MVTKCTATFLWFTVYSVNIKFSVHLSILCYEMQKKIFREKNKSCENLLTTDTNTV